MAKNLWQDDKMTPSKYGKTNEYGWRASREYVTKLEQHRDLTDEMVKENESVVKELMVDIKMCNDSFREVSDLSIKAHLEVSLLQRELGRRTKWLGSFVALTVALILATIYHFITHA